MTVASCARKRNCGGGNPHVRQKKRAQSAPSRFRSRCPGEDSVSIVGEVCRAAAIVLRWCGIQRTRFGSHDSLPAGRRSHEIAKYLGFFALSLAGAIR